MATKHGCCHYDLFCWNSKIAKKAPKNKGFDNSKAPKHYGFSNSKAPKHKGFNNSKESGLCSPHGGIKAWINGTEQVMSFRY